MHRRSLIHSAAAACLLPGLARAQSFPSKQLRLVVSTPPGGGMDIVARVLAQELTRSANLSVMVDNKPGGAGAVATREMLRSPPDGHTVLLANVGILAVNPYAMKDAGYNPPVDIAPVCLAVDFSNIVVVHPDVPARTLAEYLELGRRPDGIDYGTAGIGSAGHLAGELLRSRSGARLNHVPYRGGGPAFQDVIAGRIDYICNYISIGAAAVKSGQVKALATLARERTSLLPDLPTADQQGLKDFDVSAWNAILLPKSATPAMVAKLNAAVSKALDNPALRERLDAIGVIPAGPDRRSPEYLRQFINAEVAKWAGPVKAGGLQMD